MWICCAVRIYFCLNMLAMTDEPTHKLKFFICVAMCRYGKWYMYRVNR